MVPEQWCFEIRMVRLDNFMEVWSQMCFQGRVAILVITVEFICAWQRMC
jgi:hypothetical protein